MFARQMERPSSFEIDDIVFGFERIIESSKQSLMQMQPLRIMWIRHAKHARPRGV